jgi:hypothetical protein
MKITWFYSLSLTGKSQQNIKYSYHFRMWIMCSSCTPGVWNESSPSIDKKTCSTLEVKPKRIMLHLGLLCWSLERMDALGMFKDETWTYLAFQIHTSLVKNWIKMWDFYSSRMSRLRLINGWKVPQMMRQLEWRQKLANLTTWDD